MDAATLSPAAPARRAPRRPSPLGVVAAALAGHLACVIAPAALHGLAAPSPAGSAFFAFAACVSPVAMLWGVWRQRPLALLAAVPLGWALPAYTLPAGAFGGPAGPVALATGAVYLVVTLSWLRSAPQSAADDEATPMRWSATEDQPVPGRFDALPWIGGLLVAAPAAGVVLFTPIGDALAVGFPGRSGPAGVTLALLGTLVGLAMVTDLARGRPPARGSRARVIVLAGCLALLAALWLLMAR